MNLLFKSIFASVITSIFTILFRDYSEFAIIGPPLFSNGTLNSTYVDEWASYLSSVTVAPILALVSLFVSLFMFFFGTPIQRTPRANRYTQSGESNYNLDIATHNVADETIAEEDTDKSILPKAHYMAPAVSSVKLVQDSTDKLYGIQFPIGEFSVSSTNVPGDVLFSTDIANILRFNTTTLRPIPNRLFTDWRFVNFDVRVTVTISGNPAASGLLVMAGRPKEVPIRGSYLFVNPTAVTGTFTMASLISTDHVIADLSRDGVYNVDLPYTSPYEYLTLAMAKATTNPCAHQQFNVCLLTPYAPPVGGSNTLKVTVTATLINIKKVEALFLGSQSGVDYPFGYLNRNFGKYFMYVSLFLLGIAEFCTSGLWNTTFGKMMIDNLADAYSIRTYRQTQSGNVGSKWRWRLQTGFIFVILIIIDSYESCVKYFTQLHKMRYSQSLISIGEKHIEIKANNMNNENLPMNMTGDAVNLHNMDAPSDPRNPFSSLVKYFQKFWYRAGITDALRVSADPSKVVALSEQDVKELRVTPNQSMFEYWKNRWVFLNTATFKTAMVKGDNIMAYPISAIVTRLPQYATISSLANFYDFWRGTIKFRFIISSNDFNRGKLVVAVNYGEYNYSYLTSNWTASGNLDPHSVWHTIVDVSNPDRVVDVEIPYKSVMTCLRTDAYTAYENSTPFTRSADSSNSMGYITVSCYSPLVITNSTAGSVNIAAYMCWGDDFILLSDRTKPVCYAQGTMTCDPIQPLQNLLNSYSICSSLKELLMKPVWYTTVDFKAGSASAPPLPICLPLNPALASESAEWSFLFSSFAGYKGSIRWIVRYQNNQSNPTQTAVRTWVMTNVQQRFDTLAFGAPPLTYADDAQVNNPGTVLADGSSLVGSMYTRTSWSDTASSAVQASYPSKPAQIMHPVSSPEVVFEIPDNLPNYRYIPAFSIPPNANISTLLNAQKGLGYSPLVDEASATLFALPMYSGKNVQSPGAIEVFMQAGDDFDLLHFNGGPSFATFGYTRCQQGTTVNTFTDPRTFGTPLPAVF